MRTLFPLLVIAAVAVLASGCSTNQDSSTSTPRTDNTATVSKLFAEYHEERLKLYPMEATMAGDNRYNDLLPNNLTEEFRASEAAFYRKCLAALDRVKRDRLGAEDQLSCDILRWECETQLERLRFPAHLMPINQFYSLHLDIGQWAGGTSAQPFKTVRDYENWLKRVDAFTVWCNTAVANMRVGMKRGYVLPRALTQKVIHQMAAMTTARVEDHLYYTPIRQMPA